MTSPVILHYAPDNASLCVRLALEELHLPYDTRLVDRARAEQRSAAFLTLNPNGLIPVLETAQGPMFETAAILLWLADLKPGTLFPAPHAAERPAALTRLFWLSNTVHPALRMLFYPDHYASEHPIALREQTQHRLIGLFDQMEADTPHLVTSRPDLVACYLAPMLRWCALYGGDTKWFDLSRWPALHAFAHNFEKRPAAGIAAIAEGLGPTPFSAPRLPTPPKGSAV